MKKLYLASKSPRRKQLLQQIGLHPQVVDSDYQEEPLDGLDPAELVERHALGKARAAAAKLEDGIVLAADTVVVLDGKILGKPNSVSQAALMLRELSGRTHRVYTGVCVLDLQSGLELCSSECTSVTVRRLTDNDITAYLTTGEPFDKAGAYGIQGYAAVFVERICGCYFNVVGLPLSMTAGMLQSVGYSVPAVWMEKRN